MIKWTGKDTSGIWHTEVIADDYEDLLETLIDRDIINPYWNKNGFTFEYLCDVSPKLQELGNKLVLAEDSDDELFIDTVEAEFEDLDWHEEIFVDLDDDDFKYVISSCKSQAYYQTFEFIEGEE